MEKKLIRKNIIYKYYAARISLEYILGCPPAQ